MFSSQELLEYTRLFTEFEGDITSNPIYIAVMNKLHIAKQEFTFYENGLLNDSTVLYNNESIETGEYYRTRKEFHFGIYDLYTYFDKNFNITDEILDTTKYICEITFIGLSRFKLIKNSLHYLLHDEMTGIYNHNYYIRHLQGLISEGIVSDYVAVFLNIRNCRYLNTVFGSRITDKIIYTLANKLDEMTDSSLKECASRLGGDFFNLIVHKSNLEKFTSTFTNFQIEFDYESDHIIYPISFKAGIAILDDSFDTPDKIMMSISAAHAVARNTQIEPPIVYFSQSILETRIVNEKVTKNLAEDLKSNKLLVYFQPYVKISDNDHSIVGAEALLRWRREDRLITASEIVPLAEQTKLIIDIDMYVIEKVCSKINEWKKQGIKTLPVSCNLSEQDIKANNLAPRIISILEKYNIDKNDITFEFSESAFVHEPVLMSNFIKEIKKYGIRIGIENYSNSFLPYKLFTESSFDYIKIDYKNIDTSNSHVILVLDSIINLSHSLGIEVIIKAASDDKIIANSIKNGCNIFQSEYYEKPVSERFFENKLKNQ